MGDGLREVIGQGGHSELQIGDFKLPRKISRDLKVSGGRLERGRCRLDAFDHIARIRADM
jgi:hypothetical protein